MIWPLDEIYITGKFKEKAQPNTGLIDENGVRRHIGLDLRALSPKPVYAPGDGVVTASYTSPTGNQVIEILIGDKLWRFLHLSQRLFNKGAKVKEGVKIGMSGNSGGVDYHLHTDVRINGVKWDERLSAYYDPATLLEEEVMPKITRDQVYWHYVTIRGYEPSKKELDGYVGQDYVTATEDIKKYTVDRGQDYKAFKAETAANTNKTSDSDAAKKLQAIKDALK